MKIFYDGDCYFCRNYAEFAKLRSTVGDVELISLRSDHPDIEEIRQRRFQVNRGFVVEHDGTWLEGDKAFSYLNLLMRGNGLFQKALILIARRPQLSVVLYRLLVFGRYLVLALQGLTLIDLGAEKTIPGRYRGVAQLTRLGRISMTGTDGQGSMRRWYSHSFCSDICGRSDGMRTSKTCSGLSAAGGGGPF